MDVIVSLVHDGERVENIFGVFESKESFKAAYKNAGFEIDEMSGLVLGKFDNTEKMLTWKTITVE